MIFDDYSYLDSFFENRDKAIVTTVTKEFIDMTYNWFLSLKRINQEHLALVAALDKETYNEITSLKIPCVYLNVEIDSNENYGDWVENEKYYKTFLPITIYDKYKKDIILSDTDIFFIKDPLEKLEKQIENYDFVVMSDRRFDPFLTKREKDIIKTINYDKTEVLNFGQTAQSKYGIMNGGFSYFKSNLPNSSKVVESVRIFFKDSKELESYAKRNEEGTLQNICNKRFHQYNINVNVLNCFEFVNGSIIQVPYLKNKIIDNAFIFHYNFVHPNTPLNMKKDKIKLMRENNHWLL